MPVAHADGIKPYYDGKIQTLRVVVADKVKNLRRLEAQRNELNAKGKYISVFLNIFILPFSFFFVALLIFLLGEADFPTRQS